MALKLRVISDQYKQLGRDSSRLFGVTGGRIGRADDNDWVLPDPERYVSSHHAKVSFQAGQWILEDISTNGVFVNDNDTALSVTGPRKLKDGDRLRFGDYDVLVSLDEHNDFSPDASGQMPRPAAARSKSKSSRRSEQVAEDLGEELDITGLFQMRPADDDDVMAGIDGGPPHAASPATARSSSSAKAPDLLESLLDPPEHEVTLTGNEATEAWHMTTRRLDKRATAASVLAAAPVVVGPPSAPPPTPTRAPVVARIEPAPRRPMNSPMDNADEGQSSFDGFCRGAGIEPGALSADAQATMLTLAGQMLREVVLDLMEGLKTRTDQVRSAQNPATPLAQNNPLKLTASVEDVLRKLLYAHGSRQLGAVEALREAFTDLRHQRLAGDTATQAAVDDLLRRLDPIELQERFERGLKRAPALAGGNKTKYWDLYTEFYPLLNQRDARGLPAVFAEEFARRYAEKLEELENRKRK